VVFTALDEIACELYIEGLLKPCLTVSSWR
jgi:hypothetical protein